MGVIPEDDLQLIEDIKALIHRKPEETLYVCDWCGDEEPPTGWLNYTHKSDGLLRFCCLPCYSHRND
jgi:hypothetical protein